VQDNELSLNAAAPENNKKILAPLLAGFHATIFGRLGTVVLLELNALRYRS
jgi:hypothetical protein